MILDAFVNRSDALNCLKNNCSPEVEPAAEFRLNTHSQFVEFCVAVSVSCSKVLNMGLERVVFCFSLLSFTHLLFDIYIHLFNLTN